MPKEGPYCAWARLHQPEGADTLLSLSPAPTSFPNLSHPPAPSLILTFPTCSPTHSAPRPLILDPADPTWNVGQGSWELLAQEAAALETQACLMSREGTPVQPWDVTVGGGAWRRGPVGAPFHIPFPHTSSCKECWKLMAHSRGTGWPTTATA